MITCGWSPTPRASPGAASGPAGSTCRPPRCPGSPPPGATGIGILFGSTRLFDAAELARRYPGGPGEHAAAFREATTRPAAAGFVLEQDVVGAVTRTVGVAPMAYRRPRH